MAKRQIEVFTAGCPVCDDTVKLVKDLACGDCEVVVYDLNKGCATNECRDKAKKCGIVRVPAVVVDGQLVDCCRNQQPVTREALIAAGVVQG
jgi:glutaredoxin